MIENQGLWCRITNIARKRNETGEASMGAVKSTVPYGAAGRGPDRRDRAARLRRVAKREEQRPAIEGYMIERP